MIQLKVAQWFVLAAKKAMALSPGNVKFAAPKTARPATRIKFAKSACLGLQERRKEVESVVLKDAPKEKPSWVKTARSVGARAIQNVQLAKKALQSASNVIEPTP